MAFSEAGRRLETMLEALAKRVEEQDAEIQSLRAELNARARGEDLTALREENRDLHARLASKVEAVENGCKVAHVEGSTIGEVVGSLLHDTIPEQSRRLARCTPLERFDTEISALQRHINDLQRGVAKADAAGETAKAVERSLDAVRRRCGALEASLAEKADVSSIAAVESAASIVREEVEERGRLARGLAALQAAASAHASALEREVSRGESVEEALRICMSSCESKASSEEADALRESLSSLRSELARLNEGQHSALDRVRSEIGALEGRHVSLSDSHASLSSRLTSLAESLTTELERRPTTENVTSHERGLRLEQATRALARDTARRVLQSSHDSLAERIDRLAQLLQETASRAAVAVEFIDWFATRGEGYEHNAAALERMMHKLAAGNIARVAAEHS